VGCALWDEDTGFEFVPLNAKPASEVFRLQHHEEAVTARQSLDSFLTGVRATALGVLSVETVIQHIRQSAPGLADLAEELLMAQQGGAR
jgi:hypothetical protein